MLIEPPPAGVFGRLGSAGDLRRQVKTATDAGAVVTWNLDAGTVEANSPSGALVFKALRKGNHAAPWIIIYSKEFYQP